MRWWVFGSGRWPAFFSLLFVTNLQTEIEERAAEAVPGVEVLLVEESRERLRIVIDHSGGVTLGQCEEVTRALSELRERYTIEVSSPGPRRPLTKPEHFRRFTGRRARVRTASGEQRTLTGELVAASDDEVTIASESGVVSIPYAAIRRSNLLED